jgi:hypothetical protein
MASANLLSSDDPSNFVTSSWIQHDLISEDTSSISSLFRKLAWIVSGYNVGGSNNEPYKTANH